MFLGCLVRFKQHIRETREDVHKLIGLVERMAINLHNGFHELLPPVEESIKAFDEKKARMPNTAEDADYAAIVSRA